jgi:hypothetical protein
MFCCPHPTLFTLVNNIEQYCLAWIGCNNIVQYCWQLWTMWVAKHCSTLFSSVLHQPVRFLQCTCPCILLTILVCYSGSESILLCLMPDDFTRQVESAATQWDPLCGNESWCALLQHAMPEYFTLSVCLMPDDFTRQVESAATQWVN